MNFIDVWTFNLTKWTNSTKLKKKSSWKEGIVWAGLLNILIELKTALKQQKGKGASAQDSKEDPLWKVYAAIEINVKGEKSAWKLW